MRVIAIDPGYERLGIAVLEKEPGARKEHVVFSECFKTDKGLSIPERIHLIGREVERVVKEFAPSCLAIEDLFFEKNRTTAMAVSEARGVIIYECMKHGLSVSQYKPTEIKVAVTGYGKATKEDVLFMTRKLVALPDKKMLDDEVDAIAIGVTFFAHAR